VRGLENAVDPDCPIEIPGVSTSEKME